MVVLSAQDTEYMRTSIQDAVVKCSERCLYQSAKWAAELLTSLPSPADLTPSSDRTEEDSHMFEPEPGQQRAGGTVPIVLSPNPDPAEARLEAQEVHKYLLAKSYFDCREYDRCAAVFLPDNLPLGPVSAKSQTTVNLTSPRPKTGMAKSSVPTSVPKAAMPSSSQRLSGLSQKALFLSFYAKYMAGEKRKDEESEMILGPADGGITINKEVAGISRGLETWFANRMTDDGDIPGSQGWLEYLFGIVHSKEKNDEEARRWLIRSLNVYPYNWGAWQELNGLIGSTDELHAALPLLSNNIMAFIFHVFCNQELSQSTEPVHHALNELQSIFPTSQFLKTQRALLHYHSKGKE
ncbi:MAG: Anaphase-promoting complex subunit 23 [Piccolia ochrophora]|nr:MAG: Anaphase-promoting complex subunit 23 [Piccolia ochrophora]